MNFKEGIGLKIREVIVILLVTVGGIGPLLLRKIDIYQGWIFELVHSWWLIVYYALLALLVKSLVIKKEDEDDVYGKKEKRKD